MKDKQLDEYISKCIKTQSLIEINEIEKNLEEQGYTDDFFEMKPEIDEKIKRELLLYKKEKTKIKFFKKVAVFAVSILTVISLSQVNVQGTISFFQDLVVEIFDDYSNLFFQSDEDSTEIKYITDDNFYAPTYIPSGYEVVNVQTSSSYNIITYSSSDGEDIIYHQHIITDAGATITYDEGTIVENITTVFGETVYVYEVSTGQRALFFNHDGYAHYVTGFIGIEELLLFAESIALS